MKVKYSGLYESIAIRIPEMNFDGYFLRNVWRDLPEDLAKRVLNNNFFISEEDFKDILPSFDRLKNIAFFRYGALGDLIQLLPIARYFKRKHKDVKITLVSTESYSSPLRRVRDAFDEVIPISSFNKNNFERTFYLDGILENDHNPESEESSKHRVKIYEEFFGIALQEYDFGIQYTESESQKVEQLLNAFNK